MQLYSLQLVSPSSTEVWIEWLWCVSCRNGTLMLTDVWLLLKIKCHICDGYYWLFICHVDWHSWKRDTQNCKWSTDVQWLRLAVCGVPPDVVCGVSGQHVVLTYSPLEQFELFKAKHADCDVTKVSRDRSRNVNIRNILHAQHLTSDWNDPLCNSIVLVDTFGRKSWYFFPCVCVCEGMGHA